MLPFAFEVNNFFRFAKHFVLPTKVVFLNRGKRLCSPLLSRSTTFFAFAKLFVLPEPGRFPQSRGAVMLPSASLVNRFFSFPQISLPCFPKSVFRVAEEEFAPNAINCQADMAKKVTLSAPCRKIRLCVRLWRYCSTTRVDPARRFFSSTPFQRLRSSTLTLCARAIFHSVSLACTV